MIGIYYFGCVQPNGHGHRWYGSHFAFVPEAELKALERLFPDIDTGFVLEDPHQTEGRATLTHVHGWTVLAWWDRSGDHRNNSNSALVVDTEQTFEQMTAWLKGHFPRIAARQTAQLVKVAELWITSTRQGGMPVIDGRPS